MWLVLIAAFLANPVWAESPKCEGKPHHFHWNQPDLKIDSDNSVVSLAHNKEGVGYGYHIDTLNGPAGKLYKSMGLKKGDVIISMNGVDFDSPFRATTDLASAKEGKAFCLAYERAGKMKAQFFVRVQN